ncbi:MAG: ATP-binding cassette domain-containing protein [Nocardioidaceae bacterium]
MLRARELRKTYGDFEAVRGIDVDVRRGEAFGFLGPTGAGKSSTMRMIAAVSPVTSGTLTILGMDPARQGSKIRARLGVCPQEDTLDNELSVLENLVVYGVGIGRLGVPGRRRPSHHDRIGGPVRRVQARRKAARELWPRQCACPRSACARQPPTASARQPPAFTSATSCKPTGNNDPAAGRYGAGDHTMAMAQTERRCESSSSTRLVSAR